jgi:uncharacterized protein
MKINFKSQNFFLISFLVLTFFCAPLFAQNFPEKPSSFVSDFANIYSASEREILEEKLRAYEAQTSSQIAIVTINSLDGYPIDDYTIKLASKWQIGQKGKDNGLLILIAAKDHKVFIASGYGMEGALNDGKLGSIIRGLMIPQFRKNDYFAGTNYGLDAIISAANGEFANEGNNNSKDEIPPFILIILLILFIIFSRRNRGAAGIVLGSMLSRGSSSRGFGGFGGGRFGGGGAGGSW